MTLERIVIIKLSAKVYIIGVYAPDSTYFVAVRKAFYTKFLKEIAKLDGVDFILAGDINTGWEPSWCPCF